MAFSKITLNGTTLMDVTGLTATQDKVLSTYTGIGADGVEFTGSYSGTGGTYQTKSVSPTESSQTVTPDTGYDALSSVTVNAISSTYIGSEIDQNDSTDLTVSGATVTAPAGYYATSASKSVASMTLPTSASASVTSGYTSKATINRSTSDQYINIPTGYNSSGAYYKVNAVPNGTAGTPIATKGTVSNNSISITPSVTNTTGYITGDTKTGTAVTVSVSELVSGSQTITQNGTYDVTNLASIVAAIESGGGGVIRETVVPQTTVTAPAADWTRLTSGSTPSIVNGEFYSYTINGTEYLATGTTNGNIVYLSDILWDWSISSNAIGYDAQYGGIWFNPFVAGTYTVKVDKITLVNSGLKTQVIFPEQSVTATTPDSTGYTVNINVSEVLIEGENYIVTMDGTSYLCYAHAKYGDSDIYLGDDNVIWGNASQAQYPFCCATWGSGVTAWGVANNTAHTVKIEKVMSFDSAELTTKTVTQNGTYSASDDDADGYSSVTVNVPSSTSVLQSKTATPTTSQQTITPDSGYDGLSSVQINAMPSGSVTAPSSISGTSATVSTGTNTLTLTKTVSVTPSVTTSGYISSGTAGNSSVSLTASVITKGTATITPTTTNQTIASGTYITGTQTISGDSNLVASNIISGKSIFGVSGSVVIQKYYTGSSAPSSSLGSNGDIYIQS